MDQLEQAVKYLKEHSEESISSVARNFGVHRSTLSRRARGVQKPSSQKARDQQLLTPAQETRLVKHITTLCDRGIPPTPAILRNLAYEICGTEPGKAWSSRFVHRHQDRLASGYIDRLDRQRFKADTKYSYELWFKLLQEKVNKRDYRAENTYNMDEKGFMIGWSGKQQRIFTKASKRTTLAKGALMDGSREWVTLLACICADGSYLSPHLIFAGASGTLQESWVQDVQSTSKAYFSATPTGWTNDAMAIAWMEEVFEPLTKAKAGSHQRLLLLDGHGSHMNMKFLNWCHNHSITVACYPPHTTHRLQPLDVGLFSPLATRYTQHLERFLADSMGLSHLKKRDFYRLFEPAFAEAFTSTNIASAFAKTGLYPFQPSVVLSSLKTPTSSRPTTSHSQEATAVKAKKQVRFVQHFKHKAKKEMDIGIEQEVQLEKVVDMVEYLAAANQLQKNTINGLQQAIFQEQKRRNKSRTIFEQIRSDTGSGGLIFDPPTIQQALAIMDQQALEKEASKAAKLASKEAARDARELARQQHLEEVALKQQERLKSKENKELEKAAKKRRQTLDKEAHQASQQLLLNTTAAAAPRRPQRRPKAVAKPSQLPPVQAEETDAPTSRSGRRLKPSAAARALRELTVD